MTSCFKDVVQALEKSVKRNLADGILLSGGLDTSILAHLAVKWVKPVCITVALRSAPALDIKYASLVAANLGLKHHIHYIDMDEVEETIKNMVRIMKSFDPMEIRNDVAIYSALKTGRELGISSFMTGDGGDELFAGYSFFFNLTHDELDTALKKMWSFMSFSSIRLAEDLGVEVKLPILDPEFKNLAMGLDADLKVQKEGGQVYGKWILRKAFEEMLTPAVAWRTKEPIEVGSGTTTLPQLFDSRISDAEFNNKKGEYYKEDRVKIKSKEQLYCYELYRRLFGVPVNSNSDKSCPDCGSGVSEKISFCRTCGAYPI